MFLYNALRHGIIHFWLHVKSIYPTLRAATPRPRSGEVVERSNPMSKEQLLRGCRRGERSYSTWVRTGGGEEIPLVQGKRNPSKTVSVARGHQRADTLKP